LGHYLLHSKNTELCVRTIRQQAELLLRTIEEDAYVRTEPTTLNVVMVPCKLKE